MSLSLSTLQTHPKRTHRRVGRGNGSGRGTYSGRGLKGQKARTGGSRGLKRLAIQQFFRRIPKTGGFSRDAKIVTAISLGMINKAFASGASVTPATLAKKGLVPAGANVKILNTGKLTHSIIVHRCSVSASAKIAIEKAGGTVTL